MAPNNDKYRLGEALGVAGVVLIVASLMMMLGGISLAQTVETGYYYYYTTAGTIVYTNITVTDTNYTAELYAAEIPMNVSVVFPAGSSGSVEILAANVTQAQLLALGAGSVKGFRVYAMLDFKASKTYTGPAPQVTLSFLVPEEDVRIYYWDGSRWAELPGQTVVPSDGAYLLTVSITGTVFDPPMILAYPRPVGGVLLPGASTASTLLFAVGVVLLAASVALIVAEKRRMVKGQA